MPLDVGCVAEERICHLKHLHSLSPGIKMENEVSNKR